MKYDDYRPEIRYDVSEYKAINRRKNHFCEDCVTYYKGLHEDGITKRPFPFRYQKDNGSQVRLCSFDKRLDKEYITRDLYPSDEDFEEAQRTVDPVTWAYVELGWEPRWYQEEILCCTSQFKAIRAGRRIGKTASLSVLALWYAVTRKNFKILVICPYVAQVDKIFTNIRELAAQSPSIVNSVVRDLKSSPQKIEFANGSYIIGFAAGGSSSGKSDQIRGQDADMIIMDEVDYIDDKDIEVIMAILTTNKDVKVAVSSTPKGIRSRLFEWSRDKDGRFKEFWYISAESPAWDEDTEEFYRQMYSPGGFAREFLAEFGDEMVGVFRAKDLQKCIFNYKYEDCKPNNKACVYVIGVDWNKITGTHICVVERPVGADPIYKLVEKKIIRKSDFTQIRGVEAILELMYKWNAEYIYCDAGYGHTQLEMLYAQDLKDPLLNMKKKVKGIDMNSNITIFHPKTKEEIKKPAKPLMVYFAASRVERHQIMFPVSEDTDMQIIPEELPYSNIGVVQQARNFRVTKVSPTGRETFSQDYEHTLTAWMLAIMGHLLEYGDYQKISYTNKIVKTGKLGGEGIKHNVPDHDFYGTKLTPAEMKRESERIEREQKLKEQEQILERKSNKRADFNKNKPGNTVINGSPTYDERGNLISYGLGQARISTNSRNTSNTHSRDFRRKFVPGRNTGTNRRGIDRRGR